MRLSAKFNLVLLAVFAVGALASSVVVTQRVEAHARQEILERAGLMMESSLAVRKYTSEQIRPLLLDDLEKSFHPQSVPAYAATEMFAALRAAMPDITYKEATLNPSNPRDKATDWEADIVERFRNHPEVKEIVGERSSATGPSLFVARPIRVDSEDCLQCHGRPEDVPASVANKYGTTNGTGWTLNETVGAQIASVPAAVPQQRAESEARLLIGSLLAVFGAVLLVLNVLLHRMVVAPVARIARHADEVSSGALDGAELEVKGNDEVGALADAFNRMSRSLKKAMELIDRG